MKIAAGLVFIVEKMAQRPKYSYAKINIEGCPASFILRHRPQSTNRNFIYVEARTIHALKK